MMSVDGIDAGSAAGRAADRATPAGTRLILASDILMDALTARTDAGDRVSFEWGEPSADGWYEPTFTAHRDDHWLPRNDAATRLTAIEADAKALADAVLDRPFADPDDDAAKAARQLLRSLRPLP